ncbi:MAG: hypothetical protein M0Q94_16005, partial [Candidatus Cloacimonetes bacterium]|nr:hypothetical protein [Candidatus Cloacimonadota bacterium]
MTIKKATASILLIFISASALLLATVQVFTQNSIEVQTLDNLFLAAGISVPSVIYPASAEALLVFIDETGLESRLPDYLIPKLDEVKKKLNGESLHSVSKNFSYNADILLMPQLYWASPDPSGFAESDWRPLYKDRLPFIKTITDLYLSPYTFGRFTLEISKRRENIHKSKLETNLLVNPTGGNLTFPHEAYLSFGAGSLNILIGRTRASEGLGVTGNLALGDNFVFRDIIKLSVNAFPFSYDLLINSFDPENSNTSHSYTSMDKARPLVVMHRASLALKSNLALTIYEGMLASTAANAFDPKLLNPFMVFHNTNSYLNGNVNNFFGLEVDWAIMESLSFHAEAMFDQIQLSSEGKQYDPNAYGLLVNLRGNMWHLEAVYTSPALYLKSGTDHFKTDLIAGNRMWDGSDAGFIGHSFGPNTAALSTGVHHAFSDDLSAAADVLFKAQGDTGLGKGRTDYCPAADEIGSSLSPLCTAAGNVPEYLLQISLEMKWSIMGKAIEFNACASFQNFWNWCCKPGQNNAV